MNPAALRTIYQQLQAEAGKVLVGLDEPFEMMVVALFSNGHVLLEGVPGTAKTLMAKTLAHLVQADFTRVQFTPDLMPSDILGTSVFDMNTSRFSLRKGPIFTNSCWPMKSTARPPRPNPRCWKPWKSAKLTWTASSTCWPGLSW